MNKLELPPIETNPFILDVSDEDRFKEIVDEMYDTFKRKNKDYGKSVDINYLLSGDEASLIRLIDKLMRLMQLIKTGNPAEVEESIDDTLTDMANYAIIARMLRKKYANCPDKLSMIGYIIKQSLEG